MIFFFQLSRCSFWVRPGGLLVRGRRWELVRGSSLCRDKCDLAAHVPAILAKTRRTRLAAELIISVFVARGTLGAQPRLRVYRVTRLNAPCDACDGPAGIMGWNYRLSCLVLLETRRLSAVENITPAMSPADAKLGGANVGFPLVGLRIYCKIRVELTF